MKMNNIRKILLSPITILICRFVVGYVFLSFGASKIISPEGFAKEIGYYDLAPLWSLNLIAIILPWIEISVGLLLIFGVKIKAGALLSAGLLVFFIIMVASAWARGLDINCGCSAGNPMKVGLPKILENAGLTVLCLLIWINPSRTLSIDNLSLKEA